MSKFSEEIEQGLLEAIVIEKDKVPVTEKKNMPTKTYYVDNRPSIPIDVIKEELLKDEEFKLEYEKINNK